MSKSKMWKEKQRRKAKEKMDRSVRAAILYDKISEKIAD